MSVCFSSDKYCEFVYRIRKYFFSSKTRIGVADDVYIFGILYLVFTISIIVVYLPAQM